MLCYLEGQSRDEAAVQLGVSVGSVKGRLERGRIMSRPAGSARRDAVSGPVECNGHVGVSHVAELARMHCQVSGGGIQLERRGDGTSSDGSHDAYQIQTWNKSAYYCRIRRYRNRLRSVECSTSGRPAHTDQQGNRFEGSRARRASAAQKDNKPAVNGVVHVSGKVLGPDGKPVPNASLFVFDSEEWQAAPQTRAGKDGAFAFELSPLAERRSYRYLVATALDSVAIGSAWRPRQSHSAMPCSGCRRTFPSAAGYWTWKADRLPAQ